MTILEAQTEMHEISQGREFSLQPSYYFNPNRIIYSIFMCYDSKPNVCSVEHSWEKAISVIKQKMENVS